MAISSINIATAKAHCFAHNDRSDKVTYLIDSSKENECDRSAAEAKKLLADYITESEKNYHERVGRKIKSDTIKVVEAVVNLNAGHTLKDVQVLAGQIEKEFGFRAVQIAIHRDEGKSVKDKNYHAHIVMCNLRSDGSTIQRTLGRDGLKRLQDITADSLIMKRGEKGSKAVRLDHRAFKVVEQEREKLKNEIDTYQKQQVQLVQQNYKQDIQMMEQSREIQKLKHEIEVYQFRETQQRISALDASSEEKKELHKLNTQVNKADDKTELLQKLEVEIKKLQDQRIVDNAPTKAEISAHRETLTNLGTYDGHKIIEASRVKTTFGTKLDEKELKENIDKVLNAHNQAHAKSFSLLSAFHNAKETIILGAKDLLKRTETAFKSIFMQKEEQSLEVIKKERIERQGGLSR